MNIGITCYPTYGGSGAMATELGIALAQRGHEVHFITYQQPFRLPNFLPGVFFHEVDVGRYPLFEYPPYDLALAVRMHEVAMTHKLDLLHVHYAIPHATSAWIAREMLRDLGHRDVAVVTTLHGTDITIVGQDRSFHPITKFSIERSTRISAVSRFLREETIYTFGCTGCDVVVIHNFIDPDVYVRDRYEPVLREQAAGRKVLTHISNFRAVKRVRDVVRIFAKVRSEMPSTLVMVGDGPDRVDAEEEARALGVDADVQFLGRIDAVAPLLAGSDLFLLPSDRESFGLSALEALACGVPVVGSRAGGLPEVVSEGETGTLCPVGDIDGMASAALAILGDPARHRAFAERAAADARARFSRDLIVPQYEALYEEAIHAVGV
ncbi:MAG: N-acetyl-alpha-D-glucosaminyl L-malate synthase [Gemmatimonadaceae bacterium]|nr:N-acetyl-alpha-D-glucosaminyl L-malate synthase [Gemmatimonadaceae bacterium]